MDPRPAWRYWLCPFPDLSRVSPVQLFPGESLCVGGQSEVPVSAAVHTRLPALRLEPWTPPYTFPASSYTEGRTLTSGAEVLS